MSMAGEFHLNSKQRSSDLLMEVVKETILKQDVMFRMQVHELHRIYRAQNFLVKDLGCRDLDRRDSLSTILQPPMFPLNDVTEYVSPPRESRLPYTNKVALTTFSSQDLPENHKSKHNMLQKRSLDLQLSADEFINNAVDETPKTWIMLDQSEGPMDTVHCLSSANFLDKEVMALSLGLREEKKRKRGKTGKWIHKAPHPCYQNIIDLEDSDEQEPGSYRKYTHLGNCVSPGVYSKGDHGMVSFFSPAMSLNEKKDPFMEISKCWSAEDKSECYQIQGSPSKGNRERRDIRLHCHLSTKEKQPASGQGWKLDLNELFIDDSSQDSTIPILEYSPTVGSLSSSTVTPSTKEKLCCSNKASDIIRHAEKMDHSSLDLDGSTDLFPIENSKQSTEPAAGTTGPETMSISESLNSCSTEQKNEDIDASKSGIIVRSLDGSGCKLTSAGVKSSPKCATGTNARSCSYHKGNKVQEGHGEKSPISCQSCCTFDNDSSSAKSIQCGPHYAAPKENPKTSLGSQSVDLFPDQHATGTANPEDATMKSIDRSEESTEVMQRAAELLIQLSSLKNPTFDRDSRSKAGFKEKENRNGKRPQYPADSFELMILQLPNDNMDEECISSQPLVSNNAEAKDFGRKLRRGRRMKDFQREILPTLAALSVHEIREDINILEGVLRSREYRKTRAKMAAAQYQNWSAAKTSRRSRTNKVRRRIFA